MVEGVFNVVNNKVYPDGYSLKKYKLKQWIYSNKLTQSYVARKLDLEPDEFKRKLTEKEKFSQEQIIKLVSLMKAEEAFKVLYFPSKRMRKRVWWQVFGKFKEEGGSE